MLIGQRIAIVGAGITGLAAARALALRGAEVHVFERAPELAEVGAGIQIGANALKVVDALGLLDALSAASDPAESAAICRHRDGKVLTRLPPPEAGPSALVHRADLLKVLEDGAHEAGVAIHLGQGVQKADLDMGELVFASGAPERFDLILGADGVKSVLRGQVDGGRTARFTGQTAWRALVPWDGAPPEVHVTLGPGGHVVTYPLRGGTLMNLVAIEERDDWREEGWRQAGDADQLKRRFAGFGGQAADVISRVETCHLWALYLHPVADHWHKGRVVLAGDAAHAMLPFMAQGASQGLEDAWVLAACLADHPDTALERYQALRRPRVLRVVDEAAKNARRFHLGGLKARAAELLLPMIGPKIAADHAWLYGHDVT